MWYHLTSLLCHRVPPAWGEDNDAIWNEPRSWAMFHICLQTPQHHVIFRCCCTRVSVSQHTLYVIIVKTEKYRSVMHHNYLVIIKLGIS